MLATRLQDEFRKLDDIEVLTPRDETMRASITTIRHARASERKLFDYLWNEHDLRCRPVSEQGLSAVRISTHVFNTHADCDRVIAAVQASTRAL